MAEVLFAIGYAWLLLHQLPSAMQFAGGAFIFTGVALVRIDELHDAKAPARRPGPDDMARSARRPDPDEAEPAVRDQRPDATVSA
jgi:hypothetical protein